MNQQAYESGKRAYQGADWLGAVTSLGQAKLPGEVSGEVDHLRGNAYMKLGQFDNAADAYGQALADVAYGKKGALSCNRGRALLAAGRAQEAVAVLTDAVADTSYATPYKAYMALGSAYERLGDVRSAGIAYRSAAIDEANPAPAVALTSLGSCFMRLGRAVDAIEAYRTALDFTTPLESQAQIWCDLGLAYVAANRMSEAVDAFAHATADGFALSPEAQASYDAARKAVAAVGERRPSETDAFLAAAGYGGAYDPLDPTGASGELMPSPSDTGFFEVTEEDLLAADKHERKVRRKKHRHTGLKVFIVILILLLAVVGGAAFAYTQGYGWPTQEAVVEELFAAKTAGSDLSSLVAPGTTTQQIQELSDALPSGATVAVDGIDRGMNQSTVSVVATLAEGGQQSYQIVMARDGIAWKVVSLSPAYLSQNDSGTTTD